MTAIRFIRGWLGRPVGQIDRGLGRGQMESLVRNGFAEWVNEPESNEQQRPALPRRYQRERKR